MEICTIHIKAGRQQNFQIKLFWLKFQKFYPYSLKFMFITFLFLQTSTSDFIIIRFGSEYFQLITIIAMYSILTDYDFDYYTMYEFYRLLAHFAC